jgi:glycosyltransferase involved in cell wall biosynthesis
MNVDTRPIIPKPDTPENPNRPFVSIIIPTFNCAATIGRSIESLQAQAYPNFEIIVSDDASTDETESVASEAGVKYVRLETNSGAAVARNTGVEHASGEIYLFAEADGYYEPGYVETLVRYMHLPGVVGAINLGRKVWTDRDTALVRHQNDIFAAAAQRVWEGKRGTGAWAFHSQPFHKAGGYDPECRIGQDMDLVNRLIAAGGKTVVGGFSTLHHKDPDTLVKYWQRARRGGFFSGRFQEKWKGGGFLSKLIYLGKFAALAAAPAYLALAFLLYGSFAFLFLAAIAYLVLEDPTTTVGWGYSLKRGDLATFMLTPIFLYVRRLAIGSGRIASFFASPEALQ